MRLVAVNNARAHTARPGASVTLWRARLRSAKPSLVQLHGGRRSVNGRATAAPQSQLDTHHPCSASTGVPSSVRQDVTVSARRHRHCKASFSVQGVTVSARRHRHCKTSFSVQGVTVSARRHRHCKTSFSVQGVTVSARRHRHFEMPLSVQDVILGARRHHQWEKPPSLQDVILGARRHCQCETSPPMQDAILGARPAHTHTLTHTPLHPHPPVGVRPHCHSKTLVSVKEVTLSARRHCPCKKPMLVRQAPVSARRHYAFSIQDDAASARRHP